MTCPKCQKQLEANSSRCSHCGFDPGVRTVPNSSAPVDFDPLINLVLKDRFQLVERLGRGAMGSVYRARRVDMAGEVAVKVLHQLTDPAAGDRFYREADNALRLNRHANIVTIIDFDRGDDKTPPYLVMELLDGIPLSELLTTQGKLEPKRAVSLMCDICDAVSFAHSEGVIHRDLKPANIIVRPPGQGRKDESVKIVDFGLAKFRDPAKGGAASDSSTLTGMMIGTPLYMSPEACRGERLDPRSDIYSLGACLYHMLAGRPPFIANTVTEIFAKHLSEPPSLQSPGALSPELARVVMTALEKDPNDRPQDASSFAASLRLALEAPVSPSITPALKDFSFETVRLKSDGSIAERQVGKAKFFSERIEGEELEMVEIPSGSFAMGSPQVEKGRRKDEGPQRQVVVPSFFIGKYEVTQAQWRAVASLDRVDGDLDAYPSYSRGNNRPVESVSWYEAIEFCNRLSRKTGREYRLPTEAEWEYACRAGAKDPFYCGENIHPDFVNYNGNYPYSGGSKGLYRDITTDVGSVGYPNNFGLYDMLGNVWEWCQDVYHRSYDGAPTDGTAWLGSDQLARVVRGGSFRDPADSCGSAVRRGSPPREPKDDVGFRIVCSTSQPFIERDSDFSLDKSDQDHPDESRAQEKTDARHSRAFPAFRDWLLLLGRNSRLLGLDPRPFQKNSLPLVVLLMCGTHFLLALLTIDLLLPSMLHGLLAPAVWGLVLGACGALLFRHYPGLSAWWIVVTLLGATCAGLAYYLLGLPWELSWSFLYGTATYPIIDQTTTTIVFGVFRWLPVGLAQWIVLRKLVPTAWLWPALTVAAALVCHLILVSFPKGMIRADVFRIYVVTTMTLLGLAQAACIVYFRRMAARAAPVDSKQQSS